MVAVAGLAVVSNQLPAANHLTHGEESQHLGDQDAAPDDLGRREVSDLLDGRGRRWGVGGAAGGGPQQGLGVLDGVQRAVEVALDRGQGRWLHLLALEDQPAQLEADSAVVDDEGDLALNEADESPRAAADLAERAGGTLGGIGGAGEGGPGGGGDTRQALGGLGLDVLGRLLGGIGGLLCLCRGGVGGLEAAGGEAEVLPQERAGDDGGRHCGGRGFKPLGGSAVVRLWL